MTQRIFSSDDQRHIDLRKKLDADPANEEVIRDFPIRQPVLWTKRAS